MNQVEVEPEPLIWVAEKALGDERWRLDGEVLVKDGEEMLRLSDVVRIDDALVSVEPHRAGRLVLTTANGEAVELKFSARTRWAKNLSFAEFCESLIRRCGTYSPQAFVHRAGDRPARKRNLYGLGACLVASLLCLAAGYWGVMASPAVTVIVCLMALTLFFVYVPRLLRRPKTVDGYFQTIHTTRELVRSERHWVAATLVLCVFFAVFGLFEF